MQKRWSILRISLILLLSTLIIVGAAPGYIRGGNWSWLNVPPTANIQQIKGILSTGLGLDNWQIVDRQQIRIGGHRWVGQIIKQEDSQPIMLLLKPQTYYLNKPEVEWMDINGLERWKTDSHSQIQFTVSQEENSLPTTARFFRAWNQRQTFAVVQWYAFPQGGHYAVSSWFWRDLMAQLRGNRISWVAVSLRIPINPLEELEVAQPFAQSLAQQVQAELQKIATNKSP
ncbi:MAG: cyanoexosortase B system-associated protein [Xenococcaceae cyanobacterium]